jgi:hypothetical protein
MTTHDHKFVMPPDTGYVLEVDDEAKGWDWVLIPDCHWNHEVYRPKGTEESVGYRKIDGYQYMVFKCEDGIFRAILAACAKIVESGGDL